MAVMDYLDSTVFSPVFSNDIPLVRSDRVDRICAELAFAINNGESIFVYGDYDMDGICCDFVWREILQQAKAAKVHFFKYGTRTHAIDRDILRQVKETDARVVIICDTGSSVEDRNTLNLLRLEGYTTVVVDHHVYVGNYEIEAENRLMFNSYEERGCLDNCDVSGAYASLLVGKVLCEKYLKIPVPYNAKVFALASMYADVVDMSSIVGRALYNCVAMSNAKGPVLFQELNQYNYLICQRLFTFIIAPKINGCFRTERWDLLNSIIVETDRYKIRDLAAQLISVHEEVRRLTPGMVKSFKRDSVGDFMLCIHELTDETAMLHIRNFTGIIATRIAEEERRAVVALVKTGRFYEGSYRDYYNRELLSRFSLFCQAGGHPSAFGMVVTDYSQFVRHLSMLGRQLDVECDKPYISLSSSSIDGDDDISTLALYNEYMNVRPKVLIAHRCEQTRRVRNTKYSNYFSIGMPTKTLLMTKRSLYDGDDVLIEPMVCRGVELRERE